MAGALRVVAAFFVVDVRAAGVFAVEVFAVEVFAVDVRADAVLAVGVLAVDVFGVEVLRARVLGSAAGTTEMPGSSSTDAASAAFLAVEALRRAGAFFAGGSAGTAAPSPGTAASAAEVVGRSGADVPAGLAAGSDGDGVLAWLTWNTLATNPAIVKPAVEGLGSVPVPAGAPGAPGRRPGEDTAGSRRVTGSLTA
ncbi:hypothetical protein KTU01_13520 [Kocuria turfanensis]|uniref:Uncharacterized protein n=1 Tax=Kocuria turfanensis TaxID=388357 RepID=A0A512IC00_9MICC|nr:hypothetical protein KTU01_13520 [Kocuria turfanensis]